MTDLRLFWAFACLAICPALAAHGATYWAYSYKGIEVTSSDGAESAKTLAHNLSRLDGAITVALRIKAADWRPPTQVYAMPESVFFRVRGKKDDILSLYTTNSLVNTIEINASNSRDNELYGAFYGYTGSVLISAYSFRYPHWFVIGLSETFAGSTITKTSVTLGQPTSRAQSLFHTKLIPTRELLGIHEDDPQLKSADYEALYRAESWLLVHLIVLEGKYHSNFFNYFLRRDRGEDEASAFAASFDGVTYQDIDKMLNSVLNSGHVQASKVTFAEDKDAGTATRLTEAEAAGRLAALAARHSEKPDDALQMANEALALSPTNQDALFALAHVQIRRADYSAALLAAERLCALDSLTEKAVTECGQLFAKLAGSVKEGKASLGVESAALAERARQYYDKALAADPEDISACEGMASLLANTHNRDYSQVFLPQAQKTMSTHPRAGSLARALSWLCSDMGNSVMALNYAAMWESAALSSADHDAASAYVSRLKAHLDRSNLRLP
jgi:tetratricopeptide (TPR) repeat protein